MRITPLLTASLLAIAGTWTNTALAAAPSVESVAKTCKAGSDPAVQGATPPQLDKVTTVSPREAKCLIDILGPQLVVIQAMPDQENQLPNAKLVPEAASLGGGSMEYHQKVAAEYAKYTKGDKSRPLLVYCHHASCGWSPSAAKHAVVAEYKYVFWLREGNQGWGKAGYGFDVGPLDAKGFPLAYSKAVDECDASRKYTPEKFARNVAGEGGDIEALERAEASELAEYLTYCLGKVKNKFEASPTVQRDIEKRSARAQSEALTTVKKARVAVEADPSSYFTKSLYDFDVDRAQATIKAARSIRSLTEICGQLNISLPPVGGNAADLNAARDRYNSYVTCYNTNRKISIPFEFNWRSYESGQEGFTGVERYTCSYWKGPKCVPDSAYRRVTAVFTPANNQLVTGAFHRIRDWDEERDKVSAAMGKMEQRLTALFDAYDARMEQRQRQQSYSPPSYSMPEPPSTPIRRSSDVSARGIR